MSFKDRFVHLVAPAAKHLSTNSLQKVWNGKLLVVLYHAVSNEPLQHLHGLYPVKSRHQFEEDLDFLLSHFQAVTLADVLAHMREKKPFERPSFLITFDDGLRCFEEVAVPVLLRKGLTAVNFINSAFADNKALFFRYKVALLLWHFQLYPNAAKELQRMGQDFPTKLLSLHHADTEVIDKLLLRTGIDVEEYLTKHKPYMEVAAIKSLAAKGFYWGAHSHSHPEFSRIDETEQLNEAITSIDFVAEQFQQPFSVFAFPFTDNGVKRSFFEKLHAARSVDVTFGCAGLKKDETPHHVQRVAMEQKTLSGAAVINAEMLYASLSRLAGMNMVKR